uniref:WAP four-disulfide core domain protein 2 n=1 Tax=Sus scrofa TaxID=9823 RepID=A0A8D1NP79_PIG
MPACRLGLLVASLLLGLLLGLPPVTGTGAEKSGVCPAVEVDMNCTQECLSDGDCADNLKCCKAGCVTICQMPNGNPRGPAPGGAVQRRLGGGGSAQFPSGNRGATHPRVPGRVEVDGSRSACALPPMASVRSRKGGLLPSGGHRLSPARPLPGPVPGGQPVSRPVEMLPQWLREGVLRHTCLLSSSRHSPRHGGVGDPAWPCLSGSSQPSSLSGLCACS